MRAMIRKALEGSAPPAEAGQTIRYGGQLLGRNERCRCGSGKKFKKCCQSKLAADSTLVVKVSRPSQRFYRKNSCKNLSNRDTSQISPAIRVTPAIHQATREQSINSHIVRSVKATLSHN